MFFFPEYPLRRCAGFEARNSVTLRARYVTRVPRGFTILELIAVVTIIGILAGIAVARYTDTKKRAYLSAMKSDLHTVAIMAESRFTAEDTYVGLQVPQGSAGVVLSFTGTGVSWIATATHIGVPGIVCSLASGPGISSEIVCQ